MSDSEEWEEVCIILCSTYYRGYYYFKTNY